MTFIFDENTTGRIVEVARLLGIDAVNGTELWGIGAKDPEIMPHLSDPDVALVTFDKSMLGEHTSLLVEAGAAVVKIKGAGLPLRKRVGLFLLHAQPLRAHD